MKQFIYKSLFIFLLLITVSAPELHLMIHLHSLPDVEESGQTSANESENGTKSETECMMCIQSLTPYVSSCSSASIELKFCELEVIHFHSREITVYIPNSENKSPPLS